MRMDTADGRVPRVGLLWRGDRRAEAPTARVEQRLGPLLDAFGLLPVTVEYVVYSDDEVDEVRAQLLALDGVLVWVNPIQDGQDRSALDALLREVAARGVWVSAHPDTIVMLGTKEVLYRARDLCWGSDVHLYASREDFADRFPRRLAAHHELVVKQGRGNAGDGVWKVDLLEPLDDGDGDGAMIRVQDARAADGSSEQVRLSQFMTRCAQYYGWSGCLVDQPYQDRVADGMLRCYFCLDRVVGFCRQWPTKGLLDAAQAVAARNAARTSIMEPADAPTYQTLRHQAETEWLPQLMGVLGLSPQSLPVIWDADFLFGPKTTGGEDTHVLCEINASAVWPFPPTAAPTVASAALSQLPH